MNGLVILGVAVMVFGAVVLVFFPHLAGGEVTFPFPGTGGFTIKATQAGLILILVGLAVAVLGMTAVEGNGNGNGDEEKGSNVLGSMSVVGSAMRQGERMRLTSPAGREAGAVWTSNRYKISEGFEARVEFEITRIHVKGSDGVAFVIQNDNSFALGKMGGGIGYQGIPRSVAIEFDTWQNLVDPEVTVADPSDNHVAIHTNGGGGNSADSRFARAHTDDIPFLGDGNLHVAVIRYNGKRLRICVDRHEPCFDHPIDIPALIGSPTAYLGVTAGSGNSDVAQIHDVLHFGVKSGT